MTGVQTCALPISLWPDFGLQVAIEVVCFPSLSVDHLVYFACVNSSCLHGEKATSDSAALAAWSIQVDASRAAPGATCTFFSGAAGSAEQAKAAFGSSDCGNAFRGMVVATTIRGMAMALLALGWPSTCSWLVAQSALISFRGLDSDSYWNFLLHHN